MSYSNVSDHQAMVFDDLRNTAYARALAARITADSVVLDLGAGLGILGLLAAHLGARRVYLVEPQPLVHLATTAALANGLEDRIEILQGPIEELALPEPADIIISVFTGNLLFSEDLLPSLFHARDRFLKPGGCMVPDKAQLWLAPLSCPELHQAHIANWSTPTMGLDFSACRRMAANEILWLPQNEINGQLLAEGVLVSEVDLMQATRADCQCETTLSVSHEGECHALVGWIRIQLGEQWLSTGLDQPALHWRNGLLPVDPPIPLTQDETLQLKVQRPAFGDWQWQLVTDKQQRVQSTFLSRATDTKLLAKQMPGHVGKLSPKGEVTLLVLELMSQGKTNEELIASVQRQFPAAFQNRHKAARFVQTIVLKCSQ
jgi:SAM-dependent methyltransferase